MPRPLAFRDNLGFCLVLDRSCLEGLGVSLTPRRGNQIVFVLIIISDLGLADMCHHFTELPNKTPRTPVRQSLNHMAKIWTKLDCWCWVTTSFAYSSAPSWKAIQRDIYTHIGFSKYVYCILYFSSVLSTWTLSQINELMCPHVGWKSKKQTNSVCLWFSTRVIHHNLVT